MGEIVRIVPKGYDPTLDVSMPSKPGWFERYIMTFFGALATKPMREAMLRADEFRKGLERSWLSVTGARLHVLQACIALDDFWFLIADDGQTMPVIERIRRDYGLSLKAIQTPSGIWVKQSSDME